MGESLNWRKIFMNECKAEVNGRIRWMNTAGFEIVMSNGKHILLDPFLSGDVDGIVCHPMDLEQIERCDYLFLSHIHIDHAGDVRRIQEKFPQVNIFVGDLSADPLCEWLGLDCSRIYRVRGGESYEFDDLKAEVFSGRHTESPRGYRRAGKKFRNPDGSLDLSAWFGNLELYNYRLTLCDGTRIMVWAGMTSPDQKKRLRGVNSDICLMHVSPKQDFLEFAELVEAMGTRIVIPHHYDFTEEFFKKVPDAMKDMSRENQERFIVDGEFRMKEYLEALGAAVREKSPATRLLMLEHHRWYGFGFGLRGER